MAKEKTLKEKKDARLGLGLVFGLLGSFMLGLSFIVYLAVSNKPELVSDTYYQDGLEFQSQFDAQTNAQALQEKPKLTLVDRQLSVLLPAHAGAHGTVTVIFPSDQSLKDSQAIVLNEEGLAKIELKQVKYGLCYAELRWKAGDKDYYFKQALTVSQ